ncbi:MAG: response regulator transcription factor [Lachnospiraceae bacterium]|nr:response regulator transcription factor [Lachnospiraceae bacterium]
MNPILIVEDDTNINNLLKEALEKEQYDCQQAFSGTEAKMLLEVRKYSVVLLDLMLPGISGEEVLKVIREQGKIPVIILTAKDDLDAKVDILTSGADDYITKPFEIKEVIARIQVQLRHAGPGQENHLLNYKEMVLDRESFSVEIHGQQLQKITKQEFFILELLLKHPKKVFSKEEMFEYAWEQSYMGETKTLDVHISNIRKKIREITEEEYIETVWGIGYRLNP